MTVGRAFTQPTVKQSTVDYCLIEISSFKQLVGRRDDFCIGLESPLGRNQVRELLGDVDVAQFQSVRQRSSQVPDVCGSPTIGCPEVLDCANMLFPSLGQVLSGQGTRARQSCAMISGLAIGEYAGNHPLIVDRYIFHSEPVAYPF